VKRVRPPVDNSTRYQRILSDDGDLAAGLLAERVGDQEDIETRRHAVAGIVAQVPADRVVGSGKAPALAAGNGKDFDVAAGSQMGEGHGRVLMAVRAPGVRIDAHVRQVRGDDVGVRRGRRIGLRGNEAVSTQAIFGRRQRRSRVEPAIAEKRAAAKSSPRR